MITIKNAIKQFIPPILIAIYQKVKKRQKISSKVIKPEIVSSEISKYAIGKYEIEIPPKFALPNSQRTMKLYDRFLPVLSEKLISNKLIIDVGANVGDTAIAILQHCKNPIICIEPSDVFFPYLERNLKILIPDDFKRIKTFKKLIGTGLYSGALDHLSHGTASVKINEVSDTITHTALDKIIEDSTNVSLIKVDTDGFDFDVIKSAEKILSNSEPILFWENYISEDFQYKGFEELYSLLSKKGYKYIYIFDEFGNLITEENDFKTLKNINSYVYTIKKYGCTRTFAYTDILAVTEKNYLIAKSAIDEYKTNWINKNVLNQP